MQVRKKERAGEQAGSGRGEKSCEAWREGARERGKQGRKYKGNRESTE